MCRVRQVYLGRLQEIFTPILGEDEVIGANFGDNQPTFPEDSRCKARPFWIWNCKQLLVVVGMIGMLQRRFRSEP